MHFHKISGVVLIFFLIAAVENLQKETAGRSASAMGETKFKVNDCFKSMTFLPGKVRCKESCHRKREEDNKEESLGLEIKMDDGAN